MGTPTAERVVQILDFLTTHPGRGFTLSELSRRLRISKTTAYKILATLSDRALVLRNRDTLEYRLGPALVPMGNVGERNFPALSHAKREAEQLAEEYDSECLIVMATDEELLIVGRAGVGGPLNITSVEGQRQPLAPPFGTVILAWMGDAAVQTWLDRLGEELTEQERERYRARVTAARRRGYTVAIRGQILDEFDQLHASANVYTPAGRRELSRALAALAHDEDYLPDGDELPPDASLASVAAPVFGADGTMLVAIALMPGEHYHARDIPVLARAVVRAAARVTAAVDGRRPSRTDSQLTSRSSREGSARTRARPSGARSADKSARGVRD
jgi:DNA-binding IclR family transcriptional regulator